MLSRNALAFMLISQIRNISFVDLLMLPPIKSTPNINNTNVELSLFSKRAKATTKYERILSEVIHFYERVGDELDDLNYMNINWHDVAQTRFDAVSNLLWEPITSVNDTNIGFDDDEPVLRWFYKPSDDMSHYKQKECCPSEGLLKIVDNMFNGGGE